MGTTEYSVYHTMETIYRDSFDSPHVGNGLEVNIREEQDYA